jgi:hypothetical protein
MLPFIGGLPCKSNPVDARTITTFNNGSRWGYKNSSRYKVPAKVANASEFRGPLAGNYFLFRKAIYFESAVLITSNLFILTLDYNSAISTDNNSILIVWICSTACISNPKKSNKFLSPRNESIYSGEMYEAILNTFQRIIDVYIPSAFLLIQLIKRQTQFIISIQKC